MKPFLLFCVLSLSGFNSTAQAKNQAAAPLQITFLLAAHFLGFASFDMDVLRTHLGLLLDEQDAAAVPETFDHIILVTANGDRHEISLDRLGALRSASAVLFQEIRNHFVIDDTGVTQRQAKKSKSRRKKKVQTEEKEKDESGPVLHINIQSSTLLMLMASEEMQDPGSYLRNFNFRQPMLQSMFSEALNIESIPLMLLIADELKKSTDTSKKQNEIRDKLTAFLMKKIHPDSNFEELFDALKFAEKGLLDRSSLIKVSNTYSVLLENNTPERSYKYGLLCEAMYFSSKTEESNPEYLLAAYSHYQIAGEKSYARGFLASNRVLPWILFLEGKRLLEDPKSNAEKLKKALLMIHVARTFHLQRAKDYIEKIKSSGNAGQPRKQKHDPKPKWLLEAERTNPQALQRFLNSVLRELFSGEHGHSKPGETLSLKFDPDYPQFAAYLSDIAPGGNLELMMDLETDESENALYKLGDCYLEGSVPLQMIQVAYLRAWRYHKRQLAQDEASICFLHDLYGRFGGFLGSDAYAAHSAYFKKLLIQRNPEVHSSTYGDQLGVLGIRVLTTRLERLMEAPHLAPKNKEELIALYLDGLYLDLAGDGLVHEFLESVRSSTKGPLLSRAETIFAQRKAEIPGFDIHNKDDVQNLMSAHLGETLQKLIDIHLPSGRIAEIDFESINDFFPYLVSDPRDEIELDDEPTSLSLEETSAEPVLSTEVIDDFSSETTSTTTTTTTTTTVEPEEENLVQNQSEDSTQVESQDDHTEGEDNAPADVRVKKKSRFLSLPWKKRSKDEKKAEQTKRHQQLASTAVTRVPMSLLPSFAIPRPVMAMASMLNMLRGFRSSVVGDLRTLFSTPAYLFRAQRGAITASTIPRVLLALRDAGLIQLADTIRETASGYKFVDNKIEANSPLDPTIKFGTHTHDHPGAEWQDNAAMRDEFLDFVKKVLPADVKDALDKV